MTTGTSLGIHHLALQSAVDVRELFRLLGYDLEPDYAYEGEELNQFELDPADHASVRRIHIIGGRDRHTVYLFEVNDLRTTRLRGLAWNVLQRGTALLVVTRDYREVLFVDPRFVGSPTKSNVRVNKLKMVTSDPTRHDLDTLNAIHAHRRSGQQVYDAQAEAFNVTTVTNRFYREYREHYEQARQLVQQYNPGIHDFYNAEKLHAFTQRLLGRLMFLYFLQRKGWLGGRQKFLTEQYRHTLRQHADEIGQGETFYYYREVLEPLFFETLNQRRPDNVTRWQGLRIPYLNGGLFDRDRGPDGMIVLPDALFDPQSSDGLLAFFNRYNFTIEDDTPLEQDVSVDPEMLGKVFENLLEERDRGQSGSFYTPRAIVSYMCQEALAGYLEESAGASRERVRAQFDPDNDQPFSPDEAERVNPALDTLTALDPAVGSGSFLIGMMTEIIRLRGACARALGQEITPALIADWKERIIRDTLYGVDIKPEAIEIAQLRLWLALVVDQTLEQARPLPNLDYRLMAGNSLIETIDGQPVLGELATRMLQTQTGTAEWEQVNDQLKLFDPNPVQGRMALFESDREALNLPQLRERFFRATPEERKTLREEIAAQERRIVFASLHERAEALQLTIDQIGRKAAQTGGKLKPADMKKLQDASERLARIHDAETEMKKPDGRRPFFLYHLHFSEVFAAKGGFDIVIANPPYVDAREITDQKPEFRLTYQNVYSGTADLYVFFFARAYELLKHSGQIAFITSNKYMRTGYGAKLRRFLTSHLLLNAVIDFGDLPIFDAAAYPSIIIGRKQASENNVVRAIHVRDMSIIDNLVHCIETEATYFPQSELNERVWQLIASEERRLLRKIWQHSTALTEHIDDKLYSGIKTAANHVFEIDEAMRTRIVANNPNSGQIIRRWIRGRDVKRWSVETTNLYLVAVQNSRDFRASNPWRDAAQESIARAIFAETHPAVHEHLSRFEDKLRTRSDQGQWWWELRPCAYYDIFEKPKIVWAKYSIEPAFALDNMKTLTANTVFMLPTYDLFLLGILNSRPIQWYAKHNFNLVRGGYVEWIPANVGQLPIPDTSPNLRDQITLLTRRCLDAAKDAPEQLPALEAQLNALVYQAYGLDEADIAVIEGYLGGQDKAADMPESAGHDDAE